ncbi:glycoside hydrolase family 6 protein [Streptomyces hiroshimensis]|uniref:Glucanase n=1 Tax=Streptomyces hiroshimensis TaxID=66424 RepID=A0ABQ2YL00_9ACTN|nr:glycoside hydrolase family 6 protein [Streptomyces hiroshimensis]GGX86503.1 hypothetical protein GCM10010324_35040 [Streptomyces hiroshimensis]
MCAGALSLAGTACEALTEDDDNLDATSPFWVEPRGPAARQVRVWQEQGREDDAVVLQRIAKEPMAVWLTGDDPKAQAESVTRQSERSGVIPVLVAYNIPQRDCGQYSSGGAPDAAHYRAWAARAAAGIGARRAWIVLEPDALAQWASGCVPQAAAKQRLALIAQAVRIFKSKPGVSVYIDAGNPGWIRDHNMMVTALTEAGIAEADGFALNVSNFHTTAVTRAYGDRLSALLGGAHYVIDTSRNGNGPLPVPPEDGKKKKDEHKKEKEKEKEKEDGKEAGKEQQPVPQAAGARRAVGTREPEDVEEAEPEEGEEEHEPESWCNPPGRALGTPPTTATGNPRIDAFLWIKRPGESDGACRGAPPAGRWWAEYALELARATPSHLAPPSLEPGQPEVPLLPSVLPADPPSAAPGGGAESPAAPAPAPVPAPVPAPATAPTAGTAQGSAPAAPPAAPPAGPPTDPPAEKPVPPVPGTGPAGPGHHG